MRMALTPILKSKVDELFLQWLSLPGTQKVLHDDLNKLLEGRPLSPRQLTPSLSPGSLSCHNRPISPPAPPASSPTPNRSPRSPRDRARRPVSRSPPRSPKIERNEPRNSMKEGHLVLNDITISPGCASTMPQFYFPFGKPKNPSAPNSELLFKKISQVFNVFDAGKAGKEHFGAVTKVFMSVFNTCSFIASKKYPYLKNYSKI